MRRLGKPGLRRRAAAVGAAVSVGSAALVGGAAWAAPGDLDPGFGGAGHGQVEFDLGSAGALSGVAVQPDGGIVTVGFASLATNDAVAYRLRPDGTPDTGFGRVILPGPTDVDEVARSAVAQPDGKVVVAGVVTDVGGHVDIAVWRLTSGGALDTSFGSDGSGLVTYGRNDADEAASDVSLDPQGRIVVTGFRVAAGDRDIAVLRLSSDGVPDSTFDNGQPLFAPINAGFDSAESVAVQPDGEIVVGGGYAGVAGIAVLRITPGTSTTDAVLDPGFGGGDGIADVPGTFSTGNRDVAVGAKGKILLLSQVPVAGGSADGTVVRLTAAGTVDDSFGSVTGVHVDVNGGADFLDSLAVLPRGGVVALGDDGPGTPLYVVKLRATGAPDLAMGAGGVKILPKPLDNPALAKLRSCRTGASSSWAPSAPTPASSTDCWVT